MNTNPSNSHHDQKRSKIPTLPPQGSDAKPMVALLIDGENVSSQPIDQIMAEAEKMGMVTIRRLYGNWAKNNLQRWKNATRRHSFETIHNFPSRKGKNGIDIALTIDVMDMLLKNNIKHFCIITHDGDFVPLAQRLRREGYIVWSMGGTETSQELQKACSRFVFIEGISAFPGLATEPTSIQRKRDISENEDRRGEQLKKAYLRALIHPNNEWIPVHQLGSKLKKIVPNYKAFPGKKSLTMLVKEHEDLFEIRNPLQDNHIEVKLRKQHADKVPNAIVRR